jgi:hypothetical protein
MSAKNTEAAGTNWLQAMIGEIIDLQRQLEDSNARIGNNQQVRQQYDEAMTKVLLLLKFSFHLPSHFIKSSENIRETKKAFSSSTTSSTATTTSKEPIEPIKWLYATIF